MKKITIFEIALTGIILSLAITAKYFDKFIPHVHPIHVVVLIIGFSLMRFKMSIILLWSYLGLKFIIFGFGGITLFMILMHILQTFSLLLVSLILLFKEINKKERVFILVGLILLSMLTFLTFMIIGDSDYSPKSIPFFERVRLALIWPGDWLNVTITSLFSLFIVPTLYLLFYEKISHKLDGSIY